MKRYLDRHRTHTVIEAGQFDGTTEVPGMCRCEKGYLRAHVHEGPMIGFVYPGFFVGHLVVYDGAPVIPVGVGQFFVLDERSFANNFEEERAR